MSTRKSAVGLSAALALSMTVSSLATGVASAQDAPPPPPSGYDPNSSSQGYDPNTSPPPPPPPGYNDPGQPPPGYDPNNAAPPPPKGYNGADQTPQAREQDQRYEYAAEQWSARYCVDERSHNTAAGAVIGGLFGAVLGSAIGGRGSHFAGAVVGGTAGAVAGGAIASSSSATSPGCPPGYVVRTGAPAFYAGPEIVYAAPVWYHPWIWYGGRWVYRPYPYHRYYYRHYYRPAYYR
jgi:hypothetical protein